VGLGEGVGQDRQAAGQDRGTTDTLEHPGRNERGAVLRESAPRRTETGGNQPGDVRTPPADRVTDRPGGEQRGGQPDAHRAEDPGAGAGARTEVGSGLGQVAIGDT